jgi:hypothetical protein
MDLHAWITQQVDAAERSIEDDVLPSDEAAVVLRRCEADHRILARHRLDPDQTAFTAACKGCDLDSWGLPNTDNLNDCPELLDLAHAHGITDEILAGLDRPQAPEVKPRDNGERSLPDDAAYELRITRYPTQPISTSDVPAALRGTNRKP